MQEYDFNVLTVRDVGYLPYELYVIKRDDQGFYLSYLDLTIHGNIPYDKDDLVYIYTELNEEDMLEYRSDIKCIHVIYKNIQGFGNKIKSKVRKRV